MNKPVVQQSEVLCERCAEPLEDGKCPICSQQVLYTMSNGTETFPLTIYRGRCLLCAVVAEEKDHYGYSRTYLTACGEVVPWGCSISSRLPTCKKCKHVLRNRGADDGTVKDPVVGYHSKYTIEGVKRHHGEKLPPDETDAFVLQPRDVVGHGKRRRGRIPTRWYRASGGCPPNGNVVHVSRRNLGRKPKGKKRGGTSP